MKIKMLCLALLCATNLHAESLTRMILFKLDLPKGSEAEKVFIEKTMALAKAPGVAEFAWMNLSEKNTNFNYGVRIIFPDETALKGYVKSKEHSSYIRDTWKPVVKGMQLFDYTEPQVAAGPAKVAAENIQRGKMSLETWNPDDGTFQTLGGTPAVENGEPVTKFNVKPPAIQSIFVVGRENS